MPTRIAEDLDEIQRTVLDRLPANVATLRDLYRLTNEQIGAAVGRNRAWANGRLARQTPFTMVEALAVARLFSVPLDLLLSDQMEMLAYVAEHGEPDAVAELRGRPISWSDDPAGTPLLIPAA